MNIKTIASAVLAAVVLCAAPAFADGKIHGFVYDGDTDPADAAIFVDGGEGYVDYPYGPA